VALAIASGTLFALESYVAGAITGIAAVIVVGLWHWSRWRRDDDRHTLWQRSSSDGRELTRGGEPNAWRSGAVPLLCALSVVGTKTVTTMV